MEGEKKLALRVIGLALQDYNKGPTYRHYKEAKEFFESKWLGFWCSILGAKPENIRRMINGEDQTADGEGRKTERNEL